MSVGYKRSQFPISLVCVYPTSIPSFFGCYLSLSYFVMPVSRYMYLTAFAALLSVAVSDDPNSICYSYGVDFVDEGKYFINSLSSDPFSSVSTFKGCNADVADILLVDPSNDEYLCDEIPTTPADTPQLAKCPVLKNQMSSGHWILLILGNNGDDAQPFAWQRGMLELTCSHLHTHKFRSLPHIGSSGDEYIYINSHAQHYHNPFGNIDPILNVHVCD